MLSLRYLYRVPECVNYGDLRLVFGRNPSLADTALCTRGAFLEDGDHQVRSVLKSEVLQDGRVLLQDVAALNLELETVGGDILEAEVGPSLLNDLLEILDFKRRVCLDLNGGLVPRDRREAHYRPLFAALRRLFLLMLIVVVVEKLLLLVCGLKVDILLRCNLGMFEPFCCRIFLDGKRREALGAALVIVLDLALRVVRGLVDFLEVAERLGRAKNLLGLGQGLEGVQPIYHIVVRFLEGAVVRNKLDEIRLVLPRDRLQALALLHLDEHVEGVQHVVHELVSFGQVLLDADDIMGSGVVAAGDHGGGLLLAEVVVVAALAEGDLMRLAIESDVLLVRGAEEVARHRDHGRRHRILAHHIRGLNSANTAQAVAEEPRKASMAATAHQTGTREIVTLVGDSLAHLHVREGLTEILPSLFNIVRVHVKSKIIKIELLYIR